MMKNVYVGWGPVGMTKIAASQSKKLKLNKLHFTGEVDSTFTLLISSEYEETPVWQSEDESVAIVDQNGNVRIVGYGKTRIIVRSGNLVGVCVINSPAPKPEPEPEPEQPTNVLDKTKIYYGVIVPDLETFTGYSDITEQAVINAVEQGLLKAVPLQNYSKLEIPVTEFQAILVMIPKNEAHKAFKNELDEQKLFDESNVEGYTLESNGEVMLGDFKLYGELITVSNYSGTYYIDIE